MDRLTGSNGGGGFGCVAAVHGLRWDLRRPVVREHAKDLHWLRKRGQDGRTNRRYELKSERGRSTAGVDIDISARRLHTLLGFARMRYACGLLCIRIRMRQGGSDRVLSAGKPNLHLGNGQLLDLLI